MSRELEKDDDDITIPRAAMNKMIKVRSNTWQL